MQLIKQLTVNIELFSEWLWLNSEVIRNIAQIIQAALTIIGIIVTAYWFFQRRQVNPRAKLTYNIIDKVLDEKTLLVRITATIENIGNVLIKIDHAEIRLKWVSPVIDNVVTSIENADTSKDFEIDFPQIESKNLNLEKKDMIVIEPKESDNIYCDFILNKDDKFSCKVKTIMVYCYIKNITSHRRPLGWSFEEIYDLS